MRAYESTGQPDRTLWRLIEDAITVFQQDASEYAFAGLIGASGACLSVLILLMIGGSTAAILAPIFLVVCAVLTLATVTEALRRTTDHLEPSSAESFAVVARGLPAILLPWAALAGGLSVAAFLYLHLAHFLPSMLRSLLVLAILCGALYAALPRVLVVPSLIVRRSTSAAAVGEARALVARSGSRIAGAWGICLVPSLVLFLIPAFNSFGAVSSAIAALAFVGTMPFAAIVNSMLFFDAASAAEQGSPPGAPARAKVRGLGRAR